MGFRVKDLRSRVSWFRVYELKVWGLRVSGAMGLNETASNAPLKGGPSELRTLP